MSTGVGPILQASVLGRAVLEAIVELNPGARVVDRGAYYRVLVEKRCTLTRAAVERILGEAFSLPADLERVMPSFQGQLCMSDEQAQWTSQNS
jgi:hypothetical protein